MSSLEPKLLHFLGGLTRIRPARSFEKAARDPQAAQEAKLQQIAARNAGTEYGKKFGLSGFNPRDFSSRLPLMIRFT